MSFDILKIDRVKNQNFISQKTNSALSLFRRVMYDFHPYKLLAVFVVNVT